MLRHLPCLTFALSSCFFISAHAEDSFVAGMNYVSLDAVGDNADSRDTTVSGSVGFANHFWVDASAGKLTDSSNNSLGDINHGSLGFGIRNASWTFKLDASRYKNDAAYVQRDINSTLEWHNDVVTVGLDGMHRRTENSLDAVRDFPRANLTGVAIHTDETVTGHGFGAHVYWNVTDAWSVSAGGMSYSYDSDYTLTSSTNPVLIRSLLNRFPTVAETFYLNKSGITRSLALLDSSINVGASYQWESAQLSLHLFQDKALETGDKTNTVQLGANFFVGDHFMLSPMLGRSSTDNADDVSFGGLSVSYNW